MYFDLAVGPLFCGAGLPAGRKAAAVDRTVLTAMRHIIYSEFQKLYAFTVPDKSARRLSDITGEYITYRTEHRFATLEFYNSIKE